MSEIQIVHTAQRIKFTATRCIGTLSLLLLFAISTAYAQRHELGTGLCLGNYKGELSPLPHPFNARPGLSMFYRLNFNPGMALKFAGTMAGFKGDDKNFNSWALANKRQMEFKSSFSEFSTMFEYNFFNFRSKKYPDKISPYFTAGLGVFNSIQFSSASKTPVDVCIPFGVGVKYQLSKTLNLGAEFITRKLFTDKLDGISAGTDLDAQKTNKYAVGNPYDKDWYFHTGFWISYTFYTIICPDEFEGF